MSPAPLRKGSRLGKYRLEQKIGRGAFASVWKARDTVENRRVALKVAFPEMVEEYGRKALEHEARVASRLSHPGIAAVHNADWNDGHFLMASELAEKNLAQYRGAHRSARIALKVIREVAAGLAYAHEKGVLHRDVKPENILIFSDGRAALCDFGVSRFSKGVTETYTEAGTLGYMAPEQAYGRPKLGSDVFSLGLIAYEILTGTLLTWPFDWPQENHHRFLAKVPEPLQPVLRKAAAFEPRRRYPNAMVFHSALEAAFLRVEQKPSRPAHRRRVTAAPSPLQVEAELFRRRYGAALGMRYRCFRCEGPITEAMSHCPWCGTADNSFREISSYALVCPDCERGVRPEWTACPWCYRGRLAGSGRAPRPDRAAVRRCSRRGCPGELRAFMRYCPLCKTKTRRIWSHPDLCERCPRCRWPVSRASWRFCPWCGRREPRAGTFGVSAR